MEYVTLTNKVNGRPADALAPYIPRSSADIILIVKGKP